MTISKVAPAVVAPTVAYEPMAISFLEEAEVCREQARDAAGLKRFRAALGLFATAATLCRYAATIPCDDSTAHLISERLRQIDSEAAAYSELARALQKPLTHA